MLVPPPPAAGLFEPEDREAARRAYLVARGVALQALDEGWSLEILDPSAGLRRGGEPLARVLKPLFTLYDAYWRALRPGGPGLVPAGLNKLRQVCPRGALMTLAPAEGDATEALVVVRSLITGNVLIAGSVPAEVAAPPWPSPAPPEP